MDLPALYAQRDPAWGRDQLGTARGATIGAYGCLLSCHAMLATAYGHPITPGELNARYTLGGVYVGGDLLTDEALSRAFPDCAYGGTDDYHSGPADLGHLRDLLADPAAGVVLELDFDHDPRDGIQTHFVVAAACDGETVTIADPWYGGTADLTAHYGPDPLLVIQKFVTYRGTLAPPMQPAPPVDPDQKAQLDQLNGVIRMLTDQRDYKDQLLAQANSDAGAWQQQAQQLEAQVDSLNGQLATAQADAGRAGTAEQRLLQAITLAQQIAALANETP